jgi:hypothetical protein
MNYPYPILFNVRLGVLGFILQQPTDLELFMRRLIALTLNPSPSGRGTLNPAPFSLREKGWG